MAIQLITLGGLHVVSDDGELDWLLAQHARAALFVYLAVERSVSRDSLTAFFWPESDAENARHALRQSLYHLRKAVGADWIESRAHELVVTGDVRTDANGFIEAIERDDIALAVELYRGPFLDGVHLVDLASWESWVDNRRAQYARAFRKAARGLIEARRAAGDLTGAIQTAERWTARDPSDDEAQHRLIEALALAGERSEAIRQYEAYARVLEPDGLRPLDETIALVERLRTSPLPLPASPVVSAEASPPVVVAPETHVELPAPPRRTMRRTRWAVPAALALVVALAGAWGLRRRLVEAAPSADASTIAVLPFSVHGAQSAAYLGDGMVNLLGTALDGAGSLRRVDTRAVFAAVSEAGSGVADRQRADRIAARLGAARYVSGDVVEAGGQLQIEASVYDKGGVEPNARATVSGPADSVFALVDKLAARLLGGLGDVRAERLLRTAAVTTASLPAFKAYLEGERLMRAGQFEQAADAYMGAIGMDSTFALAHYRLALAREWAPLPGEDDAAAAAVRHGARLTARDHDLLEAFREWRTGNATRAERAYRIILARYPDDLDAWFQLGEIEFHHGPLFGRRVGESEEAWRRVVSYEPRNLFAITHLARLAVVGGRSAALGWLIAPFSTDERRTDRRLVEIELLRAVARQDTSAARALAKDVRRWEPLAVWRSAAWLTAFSPDPGLMRVVLRDLSEEFPDPSVRADLLWFGSMLDLAGGRLGAGRGSLQEAEAAERGVERGRRRPGFDAVTEWYAATLPLPYADTTLVRLRRETAAWTFPPMPADGAFRNEIGMGTPIEIEPLRQYTLGALSARLGDTASAVAAANSLRRLAAAPGATMLVRDLDRGLRARLAWQAGRAQEALALLEALEAQDSQGDIAVIPFVSRANERFLHGEVLESLGRNDDALRWFASLGYGSVSEIPLRALAYRRQADILERLGKRDEAAKHMARVADLWHNADPEFRFLGRIDALPRPASR
jgi:DNA-binding SARP family transcriptional activator